MEKLENKSIWFKRNTWIHAPFQTIAVGCLLVFSLNIYYIKILAIICIVIFGKIVNVYFINDIFIISV